MNYKCILICTRYEEWDRAYTLAYNRLPAYRQAVLHIVTNLAGDCARQTHGRRGLGYRQLHLPPFTRIEVGGLAEVHGDGAVLFVAVLGLAVEEAVLLHKVGARDGNSFGGAVHRRRA